MRKGAIAIIVMLLVFPAIALPLGSWTNVTVTEGTDFFVVSESIEPPEGLVSWWTGDGNDYDYIRDNHGTMEADTTFAPGVVDEAFSFDGYEDSIWTAGGGINSLHEFTMECWVKHNAPLQSEINRYVTLSGEKAVIRHDNFNLHFYMTFLYSDFQETHDLVIPVEGYNPFTSDPIWPEQFSFVLIEGLEAGGFIDILAEFTNSDSDFMVWPADMPMEERSYENNIAGNGMASGRVPEETSFWLPDGCDSIAVGCFDYSRDPGTWTLTINPQYEMEHIAAPHIDDQMFHHVAATYDGSIMRLYMDGGVVAQRVIGLPSAPGYGVEISSWDESLNGLIDEVSIYNRALGDDEILSIFEAGSAGKTKPVDDYYQYSRFYSGTETLAGVGGWVEDYGDQDVWGDETQWLYCVGDTTGYKISVWLTDYNEIGTDPLSPGWIEPHQHPDNPDAPGPVEPRHFAIMSQVELRFGDIVYTDGAGWHSDEFHADERGVFLGAWPYGIFQFDHDLNDPDGDGVMNYPAEQIAYPPPVPPDPGNLGRTETLAYNPDDNIWYAGARCFSWEYRDIYELVDSDDDGDFLDEEWTIAFSYPALSPVISIEHHDGLEYAAGCLWISDMYSDRIAQWEKVDGIWIERNILEYTAAAFVEGMGFGPNDHLWAGSLRYQFGQEPHLYEFGGGALQRELATSIYVDIKPASWPNPINTKDKGVLSIAICGTPYFDVHSMDPASVTLGCYINDELVYPLRWSYEDVATPYLGEPGGGHAFDGDGYIDLVLHFDSREVIETLNLAVKVGEVIPLIITGEDISPMGAHFRGIDYVWILDQQGIYAPPEFLRFYQGDLGSVAYGDADLSSATMGISPTSVNYPELLDSSVFQLGSAVRNGYGQNIINCDKYPLSITEFRQAVAYALDKNAISSDVWGGNSLPHDSFIPLANPFCVEGTLPVNFYDANVVLGNQMLDDAGFLDIDLDGYREAPDGSDFDVVVEYHDGSDIAVGTGELIVEALENLGIDVIDYPHHYTEYIYKLYFHEDFDMIFVGQNFGMDVREAAIEYHSSNYDVDYYNFPNFVNSEYDYWVDQLLNAWDYDEAQVAAYEMQRVFVEECPIIICYDNYVYSAARLPLDGMQVSSMHGGTNYETFTNLMGIYPEFETVTSAVDWPGTMNPFKAEWWYSDFATLQTKFNPMELVYEGLARRDINGNIVPQLAKTIDWNSAGSYIDIILNKDLMWHDGTPFSPWDIYFTLTYIQDHPVGLFAEACSHMTHVAVLGDKQVRIYLDYASYWNAEALLLVPILPEHIWMDVDDPYLYPNEVPIGTGPFALYEYYGELYYGDTDLDLAGHQLVTAAHPEAGSFWTTDDGDYMIGIDFYSGNLPLDYSITMTYDGCTQVITGSIDSSDVINTGSVPSSVDEIEKVHHVWLPADVDVFVVVDWNTDADLDIFFWPPITSFEEHLDEVILQRWPATTHTEFAHSIGHFYPAAAPYYYQPYHVLQKGTTLTIGFGLTAYGETEAMAEQNLRDRVDEGLVVIEIDAEPVRDAITGYLWEYMIVEYDGSTGLYRALVFYRYYLKAQPAGEYEIYWRLEDPYIGVRQSVGYVVWVKG
ncbi:MAG: ABC transporter substrate-binding protein [Candidatus Thorarchaeota archaeon]|jgi:ABC-type transport system substrate-binding protein